MKSRIAALVIGLALVASSASAAGMQWLALKGGGAIPSADLKDVAGTGFNIGGEYGYGFAKNFAAGVDVVYHGFGKKTVTDPGGNFDAQPKVTQYTAQGWYMFPMKDAKQYPYVTVGVGAYTINPDVSGTANAETKTKLGLNGGIGYNYAITGQYAIGLDAAYHWVSPSSDYKKANSNDNATLSAITIDAHIGWGFGAASGE